MKVAFFLSIFVMVSMFLNLVALGQFRNRYILFRLGAVKTHKMASNCFNKMHNIFRKKDNYKIICVYSFENFFFNCLLPYIFKINDPRLAPFRILALYHVAVVANVYFHLQSPSSLIMCYTKLKNTEVLLPF